MFVSLLLFFSFFSFSQRRFQPRSQAASRPNCESSNARSRCPPLDPDQLVAAGWFWALPLWKIWQNVSWDDMTFPIYIYICIYIYVYIYVYIYMYIYIWKNWTYSKPPVRTCLVVSIPKTQKSDVESWIKPSDIGNNESEDRCRWGIESAGLDWRFQWLWTGKGNFGLSQAGMDNQEVRILKNIKNRIQTMVNVMVNDGKCMFSCETLGAVNERWKKPMGFVPSCAAKLCRHFISLWVLELLSTLKFGFLHSITIIIITWLVVEPYPSEKWWSSSVGMIIPFPTEWKVIKFLFQTTDQLLLPYDYPGITIQLYQLQWGVPSIQFPRYGKIKTMFQTTSQIDILCYFIDI